MKILTDAALHKKITIETRVKRHMDNIKLPLPGIFRFHNNTMLRNLESIPGLASWTYNGGAAHIWSRVLREINNFAGQNYFEVSEWFHIIIVQMLNGNIDFIEVLFSHWIQLNILSQILVTIILIELIIDC